VLAPLLGGPGMVAALVAVNAAWGQALAAGWPPRVTWRGALGVAACAAVTALLAWPAPLPGPTAQAGPWMLLMPGDVGVPRAGAPEAARAALRSYMARTLAALGPGSAPPGEARRAEPLLVVWPESAAQDDVARGKTLVELHQIAGLAGADLMLGSDTREHGRDYNSLFLVQGDVFDFRRYDKRALVPFGEYVPAGFRFLFGAKVTAGEQDYARGEEPPVLPWRGTRLGLAICFESTLPAHVSAAVADGAQVIVAIANDAWLTPAAQTHHLRLSALRGLEAGRDMVFVSNGGWTALLRGGHVARLTSAQGPPLLVRPIMATHVTPWARWGALVPLAAAALAVGIAALGRAFVRRR
jgi:apolipoprotein N-acyltransferase